MADKNLKIIVFVEIPKNSVHKYEFDEELGGIKLDRTLYSPMYFPFEYGFIKDTLGEDGDPLDCVLISSFPTFPGCLVPSRVIGFLEMEDESGIDHKILALPEEKIDPRLAEMKEIEDLPEHWKKEIKEFLENYKNLEPGKWVKIKDFKKKEEAEDLVRKARERYSQKNV
jgi:inorganic pyrophosphatase